MKMIKTIMITVVLVLSVIQSTCVAQQQQQASERNLEFKLSSIPMSEKQYGQVFALDEPEVPKPGKYVAEVIIPQYPNKELERKDWVRLVSESDIFKNKLMTKENQALIEELLEYAQTYRAYWAKSQPHFHSGEELGKNYYYFPGQTEEDAQNMALAFLEGLDKENAEGLANLKRDLKQRYEKSAQLEKDAAELQVKKRPIDEQLETYRNTIYYQTIEDARKSIFEWSNLINMIDVDIVGIQAKLETVGRQREENRKRKNPMESITNALFQIEMANKIELAGALARKKAAQESLEKAIAFVGLSEETARLAASLKRAKQSLAEVQFAIEWGEDMLADLPVYLKPIEVLDNTVTIYPLK